MRSSARGAERLQYTEIAPQLIHVLVWFYLGLALGVFSTSHGGGLDQPFGTMGFARSNVQALLGLVSPWIGLSLMGIGGLLLAWAPRLHPVLYVARAAAAFGAATTAAHSALLLSFA